MQMHGIPSPAQPMMYCTVQFYTFRPRLQLCDELARREPKRWRHVTWRSDVHSQMACRNYFRLISTVNWIFYCAGAILKNCSSLTKDRKNRKQVCGPLLGPKATYHISFYSDTVPLMLKLLCLIILLPESLFLSSCCTALVRVSPLLASFCSVFSIFVVVVVVLGLTTTGSSCLTIFQYS